MDDHMVAVCAGLTADARVLINRARIECQSYRLSVEDAPPTKHIARFIAETQQKYTVRGGRRPFGLSTLIGGWHPDSKEMSLWQTTPSGIYTEWKANAIGRKDKMLNEFLEKHYKDSLNIDECVKLCIRALLEVVEHGSKNIDIGVLEMGKSIKKLDLKDVTTIVEEIQKEEVFAKF
jgi:20S proteasome alpha/beta subunit